MKFQYYLGIDVSKNSIDVHLRDHDKTLMSQAFGNSSKGLKVLSSELSGITDHKWENTLVCMEHTGIYINLLVDFLHDKDANIWVEKGLQIKKSIGMTRGKSDQVDAQRIADYCFRYQDKCNLWQPVRANLQRLKKLALIRKQLLKTRDQLEVSMKESMAFEDKQIRQLEKKFKNPIISKIKTHIQDVDKSIADTIQEDTQLKNLYGKICSVTGVGKVTAVAMIVTSNEFKGIQTPKKYACYAGVAPYPYQSGKSIKGREKVSHLANKSIKTLLQMCALSAINSKGEIQDYYIRKVAEGKNKMLVLNAIRNKIIHRVYAVIRDDRKYVKNNLNILV